MYKSSFGISTVSTLGGGKGSSHAKLDRQSYVSKVSSSDNKHIIAYPVEVHVQLFS